MERSSVRVPHRKDLLEKGAVGIAVEIDVAESKRLENGGQIVRRIRGAVQRRALSKRPAAGAVQLHGPFVGGLQFRAIDRT